MKSAYDKKTKELPALIKADPRGGRRPGAGRKGLDTSGTIVTTVRLTGEQKATLDMLGGVQHLRDYLQSIIDNRLHD